MHAPINLQNQFKVSENKIWFKKWWPEGVPKTYDFSPITTYEFLENTVRKYPSSNFIWFLETWCTYEEFLNLVDSLASGLHDLGITKGEVIAIFLPNSIQYIALYYAITKLGAIITGINPTYQPIEILHQLEVTGARTIVILDSLYKTSIEPIIEKLDLNRIIYTNLADFSRHLLVQKVIGKFLKKIPSGKVSYPGAIKLKDLVKSQKQDFEVEIDPLVDPAVYMMTGGSTGTPKAAVITHFNAVSNAIQCKLWLGGERHGLGNIGILPLFHSFSHTAIMNVTIAFGGWILLYPTLPSQEELCENIQRLSSEEGYLYLGAEVLFVKLLGYKAIRKFPRVIDTIKYFISGAGPLHERIRENFQEKFNKTIVEGYGLTEASPVVSAGKLTEDTPAGTIGTPLPGTQWGIWPLEDFSKGPICLGDPEDTNFGEENLGEICVSGPQVMAGYLNQIEETNQTLITYDDRIWLLTGDIGYMKEDGTIVIKDRKKQLIKYKGFSVFPEEVEELLLKHPDITEAAVAGLPHKEFGEVIKAWVAIKEDSHLSPKSIKAWAAENMALYKVPQHIAIIGEMPKNIVGKVQRRVLQINDPLWKEKVS